DSQEAWQGLARLAALTEQLRQGAAADQLHREIGPAVRRLTQIVDRGHAGMLESSGDPGFLEEAPHQLRAGLAIGAQDLDGQVAIQSRIAAAINDAHAAAVDFLELAQVAPTGNRRAERADAGRAVRHGRGNPRRCGRRGRVSCQLTEGAGQALPAREKELQRGLPLRVPGDEITALRGLARFFGLQVGGQDLLQAAFTLLAVHSRWPPRVHAISSSRDREARPPPWWWSSSVWRFRIPGARPGDGAGWHRAGRPAAGQWPRSRAAAIPGAASAGRETTVPRSARPPGGRPIPPPWLRASFPVSGCAWQLWPRESCRGQHSPGWHEAI